MKVKIEIVPKNANDSHLVPRFMLYVLDMNGRQLQRYKCETKSDCESIAAHFIAFYANFKLRQVKPDLLPVIKELF